MTFKNQWLNCVAASALLVATHAYAECEKPPLSDGVLAYSVCKDWPAHAGQTITAKAVFTADPSDPRGDSGMYDLDLAVVDSANAKVLASYRLAEAFNSDAIAFEGFSVDTARYKLTAQQRAFGIRASFGHNSSANPYSKGDLTLYLKEGTALRPVLRGLVVYRANGEYDGNCTGQGEQTTRTLDIGKTSSHGFADLIIRSSTVITRNFKVGNECMDKSSKPTISLTTVHYDGQQYVLPEALTGY